MSFLLDFSPERLVLPKVREKDRRWGYDNYVKPYRLIPLYIIASRCENEDGTAMTTNILYEVVKICLFGNIEVSKEFVTRFTIPSQEIAQKMEAWLAQFQFSNLFSENTQVFLDIHKQELEAADLRVRISGA